MTGPGESHLEAALAAIDRDRIVELLIDIVSQPSPTGFERNLAEHLAPRLARTGADIGLQVLSPTRANVAGRVVGNGKGPRILLYSPIDTHLSGDDHENVWGMELPVLGHDQPTGLVDGRWVTGLGAENPKGFAACVISAFEAIVTTGASLPGDLLVGLGAGGMPVAPPLGGLEAMGCGLGAEAMLRAGVVADCAVIAKGGWAVQWEEPGLCWFELTITGDPGYAGTRHRMPYRNAVLDAATVALELEEWFATYTVENETASISPQGQVGAMFGGWPARPAFTPEVCRIMVDLRSAPEVPPPDVVRKFAVAVDKIRKRHPSIQIRWNTVLSLPGEVTEPESPIIQSAVAAWEDVEGRPHQPRRGASGVTDASVLRRWGIPTAKVGLPKPISWPSEFPRFTMSVVETEALAKLTQVLVRTVFRAWSFPIEKYSTTGCETGTRGAP